MENLQKCIRTCIEIKFETCSVTQWKRITCNTCRSFCDLERIKRRYVTHIQCNPLQKALLSDKWGSQVELNFTRTPGV